MDLSPEEQLAVATHLASSGAKSSDIKKRLTKVCGKTALPEAVVKKCVQAEEEKKNVEKKVDSNPGVRKILSRKMKMVKDGDCWRPVFVDDQTSENKNGS